MKLKAHRQSTSVGHGRPPRLSRSRTSTSGHIRPIGPNVGFCPPPRECPVNS
jgi:hypothetical protein